jgi:hypothetical protein
MEVRGNNRSVMPLDVLGRTRATLTEPASTSPWPKGLGNLVKLCRAGDRALQLLLFNEECLVSASHQLALITSLPFKYEGLKEKLSPVNMVSYVFCLHGKLLFTCSWIYPVHRLNKDRPNNFCWVKVIVGLTY